MELTIKGRTYLATSLNAEDACDVALKVMPLLVHILAAQRIISGAIGAAMAPTEEKADTEKADARQVGKADGGGTAAKETAGEKALKGFDFAAFMPIAEAFAKLPQDDARFVRRTCLSACYASPGKIPVWNKDAGRFQFEDIDAVTMLRLVFAVILESCGDFFPDLRSTLSVWLT